MATTCRGEAVEAGVAEAFSYPGFVPAYIRPLFCRGRRAVPVGRALRRPGGHRRDRPDARELFPDDAPLQRWLELAPGRVAFQGLPARICWLGYGDRAKAGLAINELVRSGEVKAPVVIGRDHLDSGSVASPYRETEAMRDGSDAIADWPILNALVNVAAGATWVSVHHGGGSGSATPSMPAWSSLADGSADAADRLERVLTVDPGTGVLRHADAGYPEAIEAGRGAWPRSAFVALGRRVTGPEPATASRLLVRDLRQLATTAGTGAPLRGDALGRVEVLENAFVLCEAVGSRPRADERSRPARGRGGGARRFGPLRAPWVCRLPYPRLLRG